MRLFIAEKPSVAKAIAAALGNGIARNGYIDCGDNIITWCFGHMLEQAEPDTYTADDAPTGKNGKKIWRIEDLPIIPKAWQLTPKEDAKAQLKVIASLLKQASSIVNAGDPDREGQLLVDELLEHYQCNKPVLRFWVSAQDTVSIQRGLAALKENSEFAGFANAARARQRADWLIGINLTRAYTLKAKRGGASSVLSVGRVQTPTLSLVVARDREIEAFKPHPFYTIKAAFQHHGGVFLATWKAKEEQEGLDHDGRLVDMAIADALVTNVTHQEGVISHYAIEAKRKAPPLAFALSDITLLASNRFGYSAEMTLQCCQSLYEKHKLTSYPRTDCAYLPESQHLDAPRVLAALQQVNPELTSLIQGADAKRKSKTWNDTKITAHHGIIPTAHQGSVSGLTESERNIYDLIVRAYIAQFLPDHEYQQTSITVDVAGELFTASGKTITASGWQEAYQEDQDEGADSAGNEERQKLPVMAKDDPVTCVQTVKRDGKTKPPPHFTEGTLIRAMENIHKFVADADHRRLLKDGDGIGTSATRAAIISELKKRSFLEVKGKKILSTPIGRDVLDALPITVTTPILTAIFERKLKCVEQGNGCIDDFLKEQEVFVRKQVESANIGSIKLREGSLIKPMPKKASPLTRRTK